MEVLVLIDWLLPLAILVSLLTVVIINAHNAPRVITRAAMMEE